MCACVCVCVCACVCVRVHACMRAVCLMDGLEQVYETISVVMVCCQDVQWSDMVVVFGEHQRQ